MSLPIPIVRFEGTRPNLLRQFKVERVAAAMHFDFFAVQFNFWVDEISAFTHFAASAY